MALAHFRLFRRRTHVAELTQLFGSSRSYSSLVSNGNYTDQNLGGGSSYLYRKYFLRQWSTTLIQQMSIRNMSSGITKDTSGLPWTSGHRAILKTAMVSELPSNSNVRLLSTQVKPPAQTRQMGALQLSMLSPGFIYEPYTPREKIPFWKRWFTRSGWKRTKEDVILELKSAYAINKLRKSGYNKQKFYNEAFDLYKEISTQVARGDKTALRKLVTENMYSAMKNEIKLRESKWSEMYWELLIPAVKIRTLRARLIGVDKNDLNKVFVQLTLEFLTKQKYEAYDLSGNVVAGDKDKDVLVREVWVFEKSLFIPGSQWRLCGRINT